MNFEKTTLNLSKTVISEKILTLNQKRIHLFWSQYSSSQPKERYKRQHALGRALLGIALKKDYKIEFNEQMLAYHLHKKPYLRDYPNIHFNISHSNSTVMLALSSEKVGVDIEDFYHFSSSMIKRVFSAKERDLAELYETQDEYFTRLWTLKESFFKYTGTGLKFPLTDVTFLLKTKIYPVEIMRQNEYFFQGKIGEASVFSVCTSNQ